MIKAEFRPAGSFIQNTPPTTASTSAARRQSVVSNPSRRAKSRATPAAAQQVPIAVQNDEGVTEGELNRRPRAKRPGSAWKSRHRRPQFTDNFDAFDDPVIDLDVDNLNLDDLADATTSTTRKNSSSEVPKTSLDVVKSGKDLSHTPRAWQDNTTATSTFDGNQLNMQSRPADDAKSNYRDAGKQATNTSSDNWTSSEETTKGDSVELTPDFQMSHIRAKVLEKYRTVSELWIEYLTSRVSMSRS